ncbi:hypothetical protein PRIEUP_LOCUS193, partial [Pristimantis euphronides]
GKRLVRSRRGKVFGSASGEKTIRKALGDVNKQVMTQKSVQPLKGDRKVKKPTPAAKKVANVPSKPDKQQYPTIEKCVPYNPADFESFAVPEEHKLSHCSLAGVGLLMNGTNAKKSASFSVELALMDIPTLIWESGADGLPAFLASLEEITVEMPTMLQC